MTIKIMRSLQIHLMNFLIINLNIGNYHQSKSYKTPDVLIKTSVIYQNYKELINYGQIILNRVASKSDQLIGNSTTNLADMVVIKIQI